MYSLSNSAVTMALVDSKYKTYKNKMQELQNITSVSNVLLFLKIPKRSKPLEKNGWNRAECFINKPS